MLASWLTTAIKMFSPPVRTIVRRAIYALNITNGFKEVLEQQAELKEGIGVHRFKINFMKMQEEITGKIMVGKFNEISGILKSYAEKGCPSNPSYGLEVSEKDRETG